MMQEVEVLKTIPELVCSYFSEEQFTLSHIILYSVKNRELCYTIIYARDNVVFSQELNERMENRDGKEKFNPQRVKNYCCWLW